MTAEKQGVVGTVSVVIPTLNAEAWLPALLKALSKQKPHPPEEIVVIDSESHDRTRDIARSFPNTQVEIITDFTHGRARNRGIRLSKGEFVILMSQDALPQDERWLNNLLQPFSNPNVAATFSRQVPRSDANPMERFFLATHFPDGNQFPMQRNGDEDLVFQQDVFFSNVSSAMRRSVGIQHPFDETLIMSEDQQFARDVILAGYTVVYDPSSVVLHSHNYSFRMAMGRYFDSAYSLRQIFPKHSLRLSVRIGGSYLAREASSILRRHPRVLGRYAAYVFARTVGVLLGHVAEKLPLDLARRISLQPYHWTQGTRSHCEK